MTNIIVWLSGRKAILLGVAGVVIGYLATAGVIDTNLATAILAILNILFGGTEAFGNYAIIQGTPLGIALLEKKAK